MSTNGRTDSRRRRRRWPRWSTRLAITAALVVPSVSFGELVVYAVNDPLATFAERIGGDRVEVRFPAPPGVDPAFWRPQPESILAYQKADLILLNGAGYARWVGQASLPRRKLVDTSASFRERYLRREIGATHQHGPAGEHAHGELASTTWLDLQQAIDQARSIEAALAERDRDGAARFARGLAALVSELEGLDRELEAALKPLAGGPLLASHPVYDYLARRYGLELHALVWEPDADPGPAGWRALDALRKRHAPRWMLWEAEPLPATRAGLESRGIDVLVFDVAASRVSGADFLSRMRRNVDRLRAETAEERPTAPGRD